MCEFREATQCDLGEAGEETRKVLREAVIAQPLLPLLALCWFDILACPFGTSTRLGIPFDISWRTPGIYNSLPRYILLPHHLTTLIKSL